MLDLFFTTAHAQGAAGGGAMDSVLAFAPLILVLGVFYMLVMRPQAQRAKEHGALLETLRRGDKILTTGGFTVTIDKVDGSILMVKFSESADAAMLVKTAVVAVLEKASDKKEAGKGKTLAKAKKTKKK